MNFQNTVKWCPSLAWLPYGGYDSADCDTTGKPYLQFCRTICPIGYDLNGPEILQCTSDGVWNTTTTFPFCGSKFYDHVSLLSHATNLCRQTLTYAALF